MTDKTTDAIAEEVAIEYGLVGQTESGDTVEVGLPVMPLRDYLAGQALIGLIMAVGEEQWDPDYTAKEAYVVSDAMLRARKVKP